MVAKRTIDGVVEATNETGGNVVETARAVVGGAAEAIGGIGTTAVSSVRDILLGVVTGIKDVANAALPRPPEGTASVPPNRASSAAERASPT
jgi:phage-related protein